MLVGIVYCRALTNPAVPVCRWPKTPRQGKSRWQNRTRSIASGR